MGQAGTTLVAFALAAVLTVSGLGKIARPVRFRSALTVTYGWPPRFTVIAARVVPLSELGGATLLMWPTARTLGLLLTSGLLVAMSTLTGAAWAAGRKGDCGCWGVVQEQLGARTVARDVLLALVSVATLAIRLG